MNALDELWGGIVESVRLDPANQWAGLSVTLNLAGVVSRHEVEFLGVSQFRLDSDIPGPWNYSELTEAHVESDPSGRWRVEIVLWSEPTGFSVSCSEIRMDGTRLAAPS